MEGNLVWQRYRSIDPTKSKKSSICEILNIHDMHNISNYNTDVRTYYILAIISAQVSSVVCRRAFNIRVNARMLSAIFSVTERMHNNGS